MASSGSGTPRVVEGYEEFVRTSKFLSQWRLPEAFDPTRDSVEIYAAEATSKAHLEGEYEVERQSIDWNWHKPSVAERVAMQDEIVRFHLKTAVTAERPWLVFTAGAMGAGKSFVMKLLQRESSIFPASRMVWSDPDRIKSMLPEASAYAAASKEEAATRLHRESGLIAELIHNAALARSACIVVDGSLRNAAWYSSEIARIRSEHPHYRIAVLHVRARKALVLERASRRAAVTGRTIPDWLLSEALEQVPRSFRILRSLVHFSAEIQNDGGVPAFVPPGDSRTFAHVWDGLRVGGDTADEEAQKAASALEARADAEAAAAAGGATPTTSGDAEAGGGDSRLPVAVVPRTSLRATCPTPAAHCGAAAIAVFAKSLHRRMAARRAVHCSPREEVIEEHEERAGEEEVETGGAKAAVGGDRGGAVS